MVYVEVWFVLELYISCGLLFDDVVDIVLMGFVVGEKVCVVDG